MAKTGSVAKTGAAVRERPHSGQRLRLAMGLIDAVAEHGYRATRVADVLTRAGLSRKAFYEHFANKQEALFATFDLVSAEGMRRVAEAYRRAEGWPDRVEAAIAALFEAAVENPGALRLSLVEICAAGPEGVARRERSIERYERFIADALELAPSEGAVSEPLVRAVVGGINRVLYNRVVEGRSEQLPALVPELVAWATSYYPAPPALLPQPAPSTRVEGRRPLAMRGGRAPGTLAPHARLRTRRGLPRGEHNVSRSFVVHSQRERILDAVANLTAGGGYAELKVEDIAERAAVSLKAFYEHFTDKEDAFLVAYEVGHGKSLAMAEQAYAAAGDWRAGVRAAIETLFEFLASEPAFAHLALVDALIASARAAECSSAGVRAFAQMLVPDPEDFADEDPPAPVVIEAIAGGLFELCLHHTLQGRVSELPQLAPSATFVALAPLIGREQAVRIATAPADA